MNSFPKFQRKVKFQNTIYYNIAVAAKENGISETHVRRLF